MPVQRIQMRRGTAVEWAAADPTLESGEIGYDQTLLNFKIGTGLLPWSQLPWASDADDLVTQKRAITLRTLPEWINCERGYNSASFTQDNVCTVDDYRYVVYWAADKTPHIAQLDLNTGDWATFDLGTIAGNPLASPVAGTDGHHNLTVGVDASGRIHVSGNHHNAALHYTRSSNPHDITAWVTPGMVGTEETSVTYPTFVTLPDGTLLFAYREGLSGDGDMMLNRYSTATQTWDRLGVVADGTASSESPYWNRLAVDADGRIHLFLCWRGTGSADTNNDFSYAVLSGLSSGAMLAHTSDGSVQTLPITHANAEIIIDTAASGSGLINQLGADVDTQGRPHAAAWLKDAGGIIQIQHVWHDGSAWQVDALTQFNRTINLATESGPDLLARAHVACTPAGETLFIYRAKYDGLRGSIRCIDATLGPARSEYSLADLNLGNWEPSLDSRALRERGELVMLLSANVGTYNAAGTGLGINALNTQWGGVLIVDLNQTRLLAAGTAAVPRIRTTGVETGLDASATITSTTLAGFGVGPIPILPSPGDVMFTRTYARFRGGAASTTNIQTVENREQSDGTLTDRTLGLMTATGVDQEQRETPWMPLTMMTAESDRGWVSIRANNASGDGNVSVVQYEVGVLECDYGSTVTELDASGASVAGGGLSLALIDGATATNLTSSASQTYAAITAGFMRGQIITHPRWGAVGDGAGNDAPAINAALSWLGTNGGGVCLIPELSFRCTGTLSVPSNVELRGYGEKSVLEFTWDLSSGGQHIVNSDQTNGNENITLRNLMIKGNGDGEPWGDNATFGAPAVGVFFRRCNNVVIEDVTFYRTTGPSVFIQGCAGLRVRGNRVRESGRGGLIASGFATDWPLSDVVISDNIIDLVGDDGIAVSSCPNTAAGVPGRATRIAITGNTINGGHQTATGDDPSDAGRGILARDVDGLTITGNTIERTHSRNISVSYVDTTLGSRNVVISGNTLGYAGGPSSTQENSGIYVVNTEHINISGNVIHNARSNGVHLTEVDHFAISGNVIHGVGDTSSFNGVTLAPIAGGGGGMSCQNGTVSDNVIHNVGGPGVRVDDADNVNVAGNNIYDVGILAAGALSSSAGVLVDTVGSVSVSNNRVTDTRDPGSKTTTYGVRNLLAAASLTVTDNQLIGCATGSISLVTTPTIYIRRGNLESTTASGNSDRETAGGITSYRQQFAAVKTADTTVNNTAVLAADPHLSVPVAANAVYEVTAFLQYATSQTADIQAGWTGPAGATMSWTANALSLGATSSTFQILRAWATLSSAANFGGIATGSAVIAQPIGRLTTAGTAGTLDLRWAQGTAEASDTVLYAGSWLKVSRIA